MGRGIGIIAAAISIAAAACTGGGTAASTPAAAGTSTTSLGGCPHAPSPQARWTMPGGTWGGVYEIRGTATGGDLWVLRNPPEKGRVHLAFAAGGSGDITVVAVDQASSILQPLDMGFLQGGIIGWDRPGLQFLGTFRFPHGGCWALRVVRGTLSGTVWLQV